MFVAQKEITTFIQLNKSSKHIIIINSDLTAEAWKVVNFKGPKLVVDPKFIPIRQETSNISSRLQQLLNSCEAG